MTGVEGAVRKGAWLVVAAAIALGTGGVVVGGDHAAGDTTRPELTARADRALQPRIEALAGGFGRLQTDIESLSARGRDALVAANGRRADELERALSEGDGLALRIDAEARAVRTALDALPYRPDSDRLSDGMRTRLAVLVRSSETLAPLAEAWKRLRAGAATATSLGALLITIERVRGDVAAAVATLH